ncbi:BglG family transcription antiterminator [Naasia aerilata]|uniref:Transcriptional antiterminator n=1 Tax=Naasia aerilata TaxID=1162966 RepID=A0ABM8G9Y4_9MICO|nr:PRD domain-containing protein [Naasia aerilata]BDZ45016.1 transcriptional antiterminator [Naasia aerilata]
MPDKTPQLLEHLARAEGWVAASELAERLGVSTRTVRSYVTAIKAAAGPLDVITSSTSGYRLNREAYAKYAAGSPRAAGTPGTPRERVAFLGARLAQAPEGLSASELASALFVSETTLESDLRRVRTLARDSGVELVRSGDTLRLEGRDEGLRRLISRIFREETARGMFDLGQVQEAFAVGDLSAFKTDVIELLSAAGYTVNELGLDGVLVHTAIAVERSRRRMPPAGEGVVDGDLETALATIVERHFATSLPPGELASLALLLTTRVGTRRPEEEVLASAEVADDVAVLRRLIEGAEREYLIDLDDEDFLLRLALHVRNLVARSRAGSLTRNPLARSIKTSYPLTYELAVYLASEIQREFRITVNDDEIAFIALHVGSHLERHARPADDVTATLVLPGYHDMGAVLRDRVEAAAGPDLRVVDVVGRTDAPLEGHGTDLVITTLPVVPRPENVVVVSPFPSAADGEAIRAAVSRVRRHRRRARIRNELRLYLDERLYLRNPDAADADAVIRLLGERMIGLGILDERYLEGVLERERLSSTAFTESLAVPHSMAMSAARTAIGLAVFDSPLEWGDGRVNVVALVAFSAEGRAAFQTVFEQFVEVFAERSDVQRLLRDSTDFPSFLEQLALLIDS